MITTNQKEEIRKALAEYVGKYKSQNKAAQSLKGTSAGTVSSILNGKDENISDEMWLNIGSQVISLKSAGWQIVETKGFQEMVYAMKDAKETNNCLWIVGEAGCGKTTTARLYAEENKETFYIQCSEDMRKYDFVREVAKRIGVHTSGCTIRDMWSLIIDELLTMDSPLIIFDEADKLTERVFQYFINFYNQIEDKCGIVFFSTSYIERRIRNGLKYQKQGYEEIYSRLGRKFFRLVHTDAIDVASICKANGLTDEKKIAKVLQEVEKCEYDLRRVKKSIRRELKG